MDTAWYLAQQILPSVSRLCENIQGTDIPQLATCLGMPSYLFIPHLSISTSLNSSLCNFIYAGLDSSKYNRTILPSTYEADNNYFAPSTEMDAEEKFKNAEKFNVVCRLCGQTEVFQGSTPLTPHSASPLLLSLSVCLPMNILRY